MLGCISIQLQWMGMCCEGGFVRRWPCIASTDRGLAKGDRRRHRDEVERCYHNAPHRAHNTLFIIKALDHYSSAEHFKSIEKGICRSFRSDSIVWCRNANNLLNKMLRNILNGKSGPRFMNALVNDAPNLQNVTYCWSACKISVLKHRQMGIFSIKCGFIK
jgi:hypothetical protein